MDELTAFVTARLDEDEANANEVHKPRDCSCVDRDGQFDPDPIWCGCDYPARVLREVEFGRRLLADYAASVRAVGPGLSGSLGRLVTAYAARWADHPDYAALPLA